MVCEVVLVLSLCAVCPHLGDHLPAFGDERRSLAVQIQFNGRLRQITRVTREDKFVVVAGQPLLHVVIGRRVSDDVH